MLANNKSRRALFLMILVILIIVLLSYIKGGCGCLAHQNFTARYSLPASTGAGVRKKSSKVFIVTLCPEILLTAALWRGARGARRYLESAPEAAALQFSIPLSVKLKASGLKPL